MSVQSIQLVQFDCNLVFWHTKKESLEIVGTKMILCICNDLQHRNVSAAPSAVTLREYLSIR